MSKTFNGRVRESISHHKQGERMAHFYAEIQGNRGSTSRMGSKASGIDAHVRGWNVGANIICRHNEETGKDEIFIYKTAGSNRHGSDVLMAKFIEGTGTAIIDWQAKFNTTPTT